MPDLTDLARKYRLMAELRAERERVEAEGRAFTQQELAGRRDAFRRVAAEFPGALRELDGTTCVILEAKERAVLEEIARDVVERLWVRVALDFHATLKREMITRSRPRGTRLLALVWTELEERHGLPREELERLVFGAQV